MAGTKPTARPVLGKTEHGRPLRRQTQQPSTKAPKKIGFFFFSAFVLQEIGGRAARMRRGLHQAPTTGPTASRWRWINGFAMACSSWRTRSGRVGEWPRGGLETAMEPKMKDGPRWTHGCRHWPPLALHRDRTLARAWHLVECKQQPNRAAQSTGSTGQADGPGQRPESQA